MKDQDHQPVCRSHGKQVHEDGGDGNYDGPKCNEQKDEAQAQNGDEYPGRVIVGKFN